VLGRSDSSVPEALSHFLVWSPRDYTPAFRKTPFLRFVPAYPRGSPSTTFIFFFTSAPFIPRLSFEGSPEFRFFAATFSFVRSSIAPAPFLVACRGPPLGFPRSHLLFHGSELFSSCGLPYVFYRVFYKL